MCNRLQHSSTRPPDLSNRFLPTERAAAAPAMAENCFALPTDTAGSSATRFCEDATLVGVTVGFILVD
jgi:hypothetical protein